MLKNLLLGLAVLLVGARVDASIEVDLYKPVTSESAELGDQTWRIEFTPLEDLIVTGLGIVFDPVEEPVSSALYLSLWKGNDLVSNDDRLVLMGLNFNEDFVDEGLKRYLFRMSDNTEYNPPTELILEGGHTYTMLAQINVEAQGPRQVTNAQGIPFLTGDDKVLVTRGGSLLNPGGFFHAPLFIEIESAQVPESASFAIWAILGVAFVAAACRKRKLTCRGGVALPTP